MELHKEFISGWSGSLNYTTTQLDVTTAFTVLFCFSQVGFNTFILSLARGRWDVSSLTERLPKKLCLQKQLNL